MVARSGLSRSVWSLAATLLAACAGAGYSPCPLDLHGPLPADAFARCREVLLHGYGGLVESDPVAFRLQTAWQPIADPPGERRATVFRDEARQGSLAIVVELRRLTVPLLGPPHWTAPRGDAAAERALAERLGEALRDPAMPFDAAPPVDQLADRMLDLTAAADPVAPRGASARRRQRAP